MPVKIPDNMPAVEALKNENIFVMTRGRAASQDIRPLKIGIVNLMPIKPVTETQLLRLLSNTPLQAEITFIRTGTYTGKNTDVSHLETFYVTIDDVIKSGERYDAFIMTGAPVEKLEFEDVLYWDELKRLMDWMDENVYSTMFICWAAMAALYHHYNIPKHALSRKCVGVFPHKVLNTHHPLTRGFNETFLAPHSRYTEVRKADIKAIDDLEIIAESNVAGVYIIASKDGRRVYVTGHGEYDVDTLRNEYLRDTAQGITDSFPVNYFPDDDPDKEPVMRWRSHSSLLYINWLNYLVYQNTPYNLNNLSVSK